MTFLEHSANQKRQEVDRNMWADLQQAEFKFDVVGVGTYLMPEPVYFGHTFESVPTFTHSATRTGNQPSFPYVAAYTVPHPELGANVTRQYAAKTEGWSGDAKMPDAWWSDGWIRDWSFEMQSFEKWGNPGGDFRSQWDGFIPRYSDVLDTSNPTGQELDYYYLDTLDRHVTYTTPDWWDGGYQHAHPHIYPQFTNSWVQSDGQTRWSITNERAHTGLYSAATTLDAQGDSSWLQPFHPDFYVSEHDVRGLSDGVGIMSFQPPIPNRVGDVAHSPACNPPVKGWYFTIHVYAEEPCIVEAWGTQWVNSLGNYWSHDTRYDVDGRPGKISEGTWAFEVTTTGWSQYSFGPFNIDPRLWPRLAPQFWDLHSKYDGYGPVSGSWLFRVRDGSSGTKVFVDTAHITPILRTENAKVQITVGVAEWIQDERDMYVGARLFFQVRQLESICPEYDYGVINADDTTGVRGSAFLNGPTEPPVEVPPFDPPLL